MSAPSHGIPGSGPKAGINIGLGIIRVPSMSRIIEVLWREDSWRCELDSGSIAGESRLLIYRGARIVTAESVRLGPFVSARAEVRRQRVLRGDLRAPE